MALRRWIGAAVLALAIVGLPSSVGVGLAALHVRVAYPAWLNFSIAYIAASVVLSLFVRFGAWRIEVRSRGSWALLVSFVCQVLGALLLLMPRMLMLNPLLANSLGWLVKTGTLLFAVGVLLTGLAAPWVAWTGVAAAVLSVFVDGPIVSLMNHLGWWQAQSLLGAVSFVLVFVFLVSLGVGLLRVPGASNKGIEPTATR